MIPAGNAARQRLMERLRLPELPPEILDEALTHSSYVNESGVTARSNERLEFLGDAVIGLVIARELFRLFPEAGEGALTRMRAEIVRGRTLAGAAARARIGEHMVLGRGEEAAGGRKRERNLAGGLEALVGAVYLAKGIRSARPFVLRLLKTELREVRRSGASLDAKSELQHLVQARWHEPPQYVTLAEESEGAGRRFTVEVRAAGAVLGEGTGSSKREAQQAAAREAIRAMQAGGEQE